MKNQKKVAIEILYKANKYEFDINPEDYGDYTKFINLIKTKLDIKTDISSLKIMTLNTSVEYTIINDNNISNILNEVTNDNTIKLYITEEIKNEDTIEEDFDNDILYSSSNEIYTNLDRTSNGQNYIDDNMDNEDNINESNTPNRVSFRNSKLYTDNMNITHESLCYNANEGIEPINLRDFISKKSQSVNFKEKESHITCHIDDIEFKDEKCDICNKYLNKIKFICCVCEKVQLCRECEIEHQHPCIKYKNKFLSTLESSYYYMKHNQDITPSQSTSKFLNKVFASDIEIWFEPILDSELSIKVNEVVTIPLLLINNSKIDIYSEDFLIFVKNNKYIDVKFDETFSFVLKAKNSINIDFEFTTKDPCYEIISFEVFSNRFKIKESKKNILNIYITVNDDKEEDELNQQLLFFGKLKYLKKEYKKLICYYSNEGKSDKSPVEIYNILKQNKWDIISSEQYIYDK